ncbi:MAG: hypothetical protein AB7P21_15855 [Lautropia sp.]
MNSHALQAAIAALAAAAALAGGSAAAHEVDAGRAAAARLVDVEIVDRDSGRPVTVYHHAGRRYVAGTPGSRYAIRIVNRTGERLLNVVSVDGVNVVTGETAAPGQNGYVYQPWQRHDILGWRKSAREVAAFYFTALPDAYAVRTDRPLDVGVIGVAVFRERRPPPAPPAVTTVPQRAAPASPAAAAADAGAGGAAAESRAGAAAPDAASAPNATSVERERIGTGHGEREHSVVTHTRFVRASASPAQTIAIHYDRYDNLVARGIVPAVPPLAGEPRPFPAAGRFVPDPLR